MKNITKLILAILTLFLIVGCEDPNEGKSSKRLAQERLLDELGNCENKFGSDSESRRQMNFEYCNEIMDRVDSLVRDGYFEEDEATRKIIQEKNQNYTGRDPIAEQEQAQKELDELYNEVIGDI